MRVTTELLPDDRAIFTLEVIIDQDRIEHRHGLLRDYAIEAAREYADDLCLDDKVVVSDPDGRIHYEERAGSVYIRK